MTCGNYVCHTPDAHDLLSRDTVLMRATCAAMLARVIHRDDTDVSSKVIGRDIPLRATEFSLPAYAAESYGSVEMHGIDTKVVFACMRAHSLSHTAFHTLSPTSQQSLIYPVCAMHARHFLNTCFYQVDTKGTRHFLCIFRVCM